MKFEKPAQTVEQLIDRWKKRGLAINDEAEAAHYIRFIGYYRLSGYALPLTLYHQKGCHDFKPEAKFCDILDLYRFDRELRLLVMDAVERVEVAFRACVSDTMSLKAGPHWYMDKRQFAHNKTCEEFCLKVSQETGFDAAGNRHKTDGKETFIQHYFRKYGEPPLPPSWMVAEILTITSWSKVFGCLAHREDRKRISAHFGFNPEVLESWMHAICYVRNLCAHHSRMWNRDFTIKPMIAKGHEAHLSNNGRFYAQAYIINTLLKKAAPGTKWWDRMLKLVEEHPFIDRQAMGFPSTPAQS
jgi:abortive infection bacteriophage resistance protein